MPKTNPDSTTVTPSEKTVSGPGEPKPVVASVINQAGLEVPNSNQAVNPGIESVNKSNGSAPPSIPMMEVAQPTAGSNWRVEEVRQFMEMVGRPMLLKALEGGGTVRLRLEPPELGQLVLEVKAGRNNVSAQAIVESEQAKQILLQNSHLLREILAQRGLDLEQFDVRRQWESAGQNAGFSFDQAPQERSSSGDTAWTVSANPRADSAMAASTYVLRGLAGNLNVRA